MTPVVALTASSAEGQEAIARCHALLKARTTEIRTGTRRPYVVLLADPPWRFSNERAVEGSVPYPSMALSDIKAMPVRQLVGQRAALFLWSTCALLPDALSVMAAWGFTYSTLLCWRKVRQHETDVAISGMGYWCRSSVELILIGHRGHGTLSRYRTTYSFPQEISAPSPLPRRHSAKPLCVRERLADYLAVGPHERLELFAREHGDPRWDAWGLELPGGYWADATDLRVPITIAAARSSASALPLQAAVSEAEQEEEEPAVL